MPVPHSRPPTTQGIGLFAVFVFVLITVPRLNIKLGSVPIYFIDFLIFALLLLAVRLPPMPVAHRRFSGTILTIFAFAMVSELAGIATFNRLQESIYMMGRTALAFSVFLIASQFVRTLKDVEIVLRAVVAGMIITATLMILTSLPMTRIAVTEAIFTIRYLEPSAVDVLEKYGREGDSGVRGRTLVGVSILGATFLNACWPLAALFLRWPAPLGLWRWVALSACLIAPMGVLMSYSRGPITGSVLIILAALFLGLHKIRRGILLPVAVGTAIVLTIGVGSQIFFFDRLVNRFDAAITAGFDDERESERFLAYVEPFQHALEHPRFFLFGEGLVPRYVRVTPAPEQTGMATHAVFGIAYYSYGMVAAFLYLFLLFRAIGHAGYMCLQYKGTPVGHLAQPLFLCSVAIVPWAAFDHGSVTSPRGAMMLFLIIGLISGLSHFAARQRAQKPQTRTEFANRSNTAFG